MVRTARSLAEPSQFRSPQCKKIGSNAAGISAQAENGAMRLKMTGTAEYRERNSTMHSGIETWTRARWFNLTIALLLSIVCFAAAAAAQNPLALVAPVVPLGNPAAQAVVDRLAAFGSGLPDGAWRYHADDLAHGEDPALDDSSWQVGEGTYDTPDGSVWFRRTLVIPRTFQGYPLDGVRLFFQFHAKAHGATPEILYVNGRRLALGEDLEPEELAITPGETLHIAVKVLQTAGDKHITPASYILRFPATQTNLATRPNPADLGDELRSIDVLLPALTADAATLASEQKLLNEAALAVDLHALDTGDQAGFDASLLRARSILESLRPLIRRNAILQTGNSHIDTAWLWPETETVDIVRRTFSTALQLMPEYPNYTFSQSVALYSAWMQEKYPQIFAEMKQRTQEGRWEPVGGMWVEPDLNMPDGESIVRQLLIGKTYFRTQMGVDVHIGWNPDSFGYNWQLPQIYKRSGIDDFVTQKMGWNDTNHLPLKLFWWQSPDGSRVLTYFPNAYHENTDPVDESQELAKAATLVPGENTIMRLFGVGDHGGGPTRVMLDDIQHSTRPDALLPKVSFSTAGNFFSSVRSNLANPASAPVWNYETLAENQASLPAYQGGPVQIPVWNDELYLEFHRGTYTSQAAHKRNMRVSEESMLNAEKWASLAWLGGQSYPAEPLNDAWKKVLVGQFHDLAAGSGIAVIYKDAERDYDSVRQTTGEVTEHSLDEIAAHSDTRAPQGSVPLLVFNPLAWQRTDLVEADVQLPAPAGGGIAVRTAEGKPVVAQVLHADPATARYHLLLRADDVPSLGFAVLQAGPGRSAAPTDLKASGTTLENALLRVVVDPANGCITHIVDKKTGFDSIAAGGCGNDLQTFVDKPIRYDAWNIDAGTFDKMTPIRTVDSVQLVEQGPLRAVLRIQRHWSHSTFTQDIALYAGIDRVDVRSRIDWHEHHVMLKAAFPLAASSAEATYEIPYGSIQRPTTRNNPVERAKYEVPALRWADLGDGQHGFSLLNDSKYGYDALSNVLRLSLLRSPTYPDPDADQGMQRFAYSLYPHAGTWQQSMTMRRGYEFNYRLTAIQTTVHPGALKAAQSFVGVEGDNVVLTAMKKAEESNDLILRLFEWQGKAATVRIAAPGSPVSAEEVGMMETDSLGALPLAAGSISLDIKPYQIRTIRVHYADAAQLWAAAQQ
jgi:alpha-mannosidase